MRKPDYSGKVVDNLGRLLCDKCNGEGKPDDLKISIGQTYADEPCDCCGSMGERKKNAASD